MPATNYTPIQLYRTNTASTTAPSAVNLNAGELALNYNDSGMILFAKNTTGNVIKLMNNPANLLYPTADGSVGQLIRTDGSGTLAFSSKIAITAAGFTQPVAFGDTVVALGNTGTSKTIDLQTGNVFTATLTGNVTFTLSNPIATGSSSFTLILTNDATPSRTVAWSGGSFLFPGGAASLSRSTAANAIDVWVFFTPNGGTTWYGNIAMKNMTA